MKKYKTWEMIKMKGGKQGKMAVKNNQTKDKKTIKRGLTWERNKELMSR